MNKKQEIVYNWLIEKPGYLKKSALTLQKEYFDSINLQTVYDALREARSDYKLKNSPFKAGLKVETGISISKVQKALKSIKNGFNPDNILAIADQHEPFCKEGYLEHCITMQKKYDCGTIVLIGDEVDLCGVSQWEKDPDGFSAGTEANLAQEKMKLWYKAFPDAFVCIGNHTARPFRQAKANGIPKKFIKSYEEAWEAPKTWKWREHWEIHNVLFTHGTGYSGANAAIRIATRHRQNTVIGHIHSEAGIQYSASKIDLVWGMQLGGALDDNTYAAYYAKDQLKKSIVGCGIILDKGRLPIYEPMVM